ncbi:hypothetical protein BCR35DRAFT_211546 [Leucosporidium creatinivorum]|uniref:BAH domain-containing protein n=1 Tax=Leucosporidium creatinivorum TaxID=106004 RepID=A0A1Y2DD24_9BASI|nr:hypothetical protein BCR35DRAFT_211546 [Leucosporidium creatinivorum]
MPKLAPPPPVMYALNSDQLQVGDWIMYKSRVESSAEPQARVGQIIGLHPGGELDQLCCRRYLRKSDLRTSAQLQQFNSLVVPDVIHEFSYGEEVLIQEYAEVVPVASYLEKCFVMYTSLREQGYPSPKYWREPMPLFVSHAVLQAKGVVYKELKAWEKSVLTVTKWKPSVKTAQSSIHGSRTTSKRHTPTRTISPRTTSINTGASRILDTPSPRHKPSNARCVLSRRREWFRIKRLEVLGS